MYHHYALLWCPNPLQPQPQPGFQPECRQPGHCHRVTARPHGHSSGSAVSGDDWFLSLQLDGASAVWAACDLLLQLQQAVAQPSPHGLGTATDRFKVAVAERSYHGPYGVLYI